MSIQIWIPESAKEGAWDCLVCGERLHTMSSYESHVVRCAKEHEGLIDRWRQRKRPDVIFGPIDPEYDQYRRRRRNPL